MCDPAGAIRHLLTKIADLKSARKLDGEVPIGYYGLQFAAGFELASQSRVTLFEQERQNGAWHELTLAATNPDLTLTPVEQPLMPKTVAVLVAVSYEIPREDVLEVLDGAIEDYRLGLNTPRIDAISSYSQVRRVADRFRKLLDDLHARHNNNIPVHVFYAGPACLGFSLGRQINKNIHHPLWIHQYDGTFNPRYRWALELRSVSSGAQPAVKVQEARKASHVRHHHGPADVLRRSRSTR